MILAGDFLRAKVFLHRHRKIRAAFYRRIVGHDDHFLSHHPADAADHAGGRCVAVVHLLGGQRGDLQERRARVEQGGDAVPYQQFSAAGVAFARLLTTAFGRPDQPCIQFIHQAAMPGNVVLEILRAGVKG